MTYDRSRTYLLLRFLDAQTGRELGEVLVQIRNDGSDGGRALHGTETGMGDIHADQHCAFQPVQRGCIKLMVDAPEFRIKLQSNI